jgi:hypothetical protein
MAWLKLSNAARSAAADAIADMCDAASAAGTIKIYDGTAPATADTAVTTQVLLATLTFSDPAFGAASNGVVTADTITDDSSADASGTATWARIEDSDGTNIMDVDVGTAGATLVLNTTSIIAGAVVRVTGAVLTMPSGA